MSRNPILPGACIGIIGGGQLGKMLCTAAAELGYRTHVYCPSDDSPAFDVASKSTQAPYEDREALMGFAQEVDVITLEFENIPVATVKALESVKPVCPGSSVLYLSQNRLREKTFAQEQSVATARFLPVHSAEDLARAFEEISGPCILKTTEFGYDGKGQLRLDSAGDWEQIWSDFGQDEAILEAVVPFVMELSCIIARRDDGKTLSFPLGENQHSNGILDCCEVPASVADTVIQRATEATLRLAEACSVVGLLAVEYFVTADSELLFNEMAPRPHNSGHWTQDACETSQFEQCIRAICGLPLGSVRQHTAVRMRNLIGSDIDQAWDLMERPEVKVHVYGKKAAKPGRKMGHVNELITGIVLVS